MTKRLGRPPDGELVRNRIARVRLSDRELTAIRAFAARNGQTVSDCFRLGVLTMMADVAESDEALLVVVCRATLFMDRCILCPRNYRTEGDLRHEVTMNTPTTNARDVDERPPCILCQADMRDEPDRAEALCAKCRGEEEQP